MAWVMRCAVAMIVAQGGGSHGFSLYVDGRGPALAIRRGGRLSVVRASTPLSATGPSEIAVRVNAGGRVRFFVGGKKAGGGRGGGLLVAQPGDGLEVGQDAGGAVGEYRGPSTYSGRVHGVEIRIH